MKKLALAAIIALTTTAITAKEIKVLPILTDSNYCLTPSLSLLGGYGAFSEANDGSTMYGVELAIACPALQLENLDIKQQISYVYSSNDGLTTNSIEFNPHVMFNIADKLQLGVGPGFGLVFADVEGGESDLVFGLNLGASLNYDITTSMFVGAEARYQWTTDADFGGGDTTLDNYRTLLKVGMHF